MPYEVLEQKLHAVPERYFDQVASFLDIILNIVGSSIVADKCEPHIKLGLGKGKFSVPDDIHFGDDEIAADFEEYL